MNVADAVALYNNTSSTAAEMDAATANRKTDAKHETVAVTIPVHDRNLLQELVRKFGWACVF